MGIDLSIKKIDKKKQKSGVWFEVTRISEEWLEWDDAYTDTVPDGPGKILIASRNGSAFLDAINKVIAPHARQISRGTMKNDVLDPQYVKAIAQHVVLGWEGFLSDGKDFPHSRENATLLLENDFKFRAFVMDLSDRQDAFLSDMVEEAGKKSGSTSTGTSDSVAKIG